MKKYLILPLMLLFAACNSGEEVISTRTTESFDRVYEYRPAPGQFINESLSGYSGVTTPEAACIYAEERLRENNYVSLGGWGGYLIAGFSEPVANTGDYELLVTGNTFNNSSEPGVIYVMPDQNSNGLPDDTWYELRGSEYDNPATKRVYSVTYSRPMGDKEPVIWRDNLGQHGEISRIGEHQQPSYYPAWITADEYTLTGVCLPGNVEEINGNWVAQPFAWGYADNYSHTDMARGGNRLSISNAVTTTGQPANLTQIDFVKIQTGVNQQALLIGEISTDVCGIYCFRESKK